jgi:predicted RNase H-like nuclease (RuvC/YqgF family)
MFGTDYLLGYNQGRSSAELDRDTNAIVARVIYGQRPVTVDQSYIDRLHAALNEARANSTHWRQKTDQFRNEALYWRDQKFAPAKAKAKALREENAALCDENSALRNETATLRDQNTTLRDENALLLARLKERNPDLAEELAAHDETFKEKQSLQRFRVLAASLIDALLAGRANRPEFAELLTIAKGAADTIERGDLFTAFRDEPEKNNRLCSLADALQKP